MSPGYRFHSRVQWTGHEPCFPGPPPRQSCFRQCRQLCPSPARWLTNNDSARASTLPCGAANIWGRYSFSASRSNNKTFDGCSSSTGRNGGGSARCAGGVQGCSCWATDGNNPIRSKRPTIFLNSYLLSQHQLSLCLCSPKTVKHP